MNVKCEECSEYLEVDEDGTILVSYCQSWSCPHSDPDIDEHPRPLNFGE